MTGVVRTLFSRSQKQETLQRAVCSACKEELMQQGSCLAAFEGSDKLPVQGSGLKVCTPNKGLLNPKPHLRIGGVSN